MHLLRSSGGKTLSSRLTLRYKESFVDESLWKVLSAKLSTLLKLDPSERSEDQQLIMERLLILVRNVLQV